MWLDKSHSPPDLLLSLQDLVYLFVGKLLTAADIAKKDSDLIKVLASYLSHLQQCHGNTSAHFESLNRAADGEIMRNNPILQDGCFPDLLMCGHAV